MTIKMHISGGNNLSIFVLFFQKKKKSNILNGKKLQIFILKMCLFILKTQNMFNI